MILSRLFLLTELERSAVQMSEMYCKSLPLSKDLDPQESIHGEELLSMASNVLVQVSYCLFFGGSDYSWGVTCQEVIYLLYTDTELFL